MPHGAVPGGEHHEGPHDVDEPQQRDQSVGNVPPAAEVAFGTKRQQLDTLLWESERERERERREQNVTQPSDLHGAKTGHLCYDLGEGGKHSREHGVSGIAKQTSRMK